MGGDTFVRSMLGDQLISTRESAPAFGFGTGTRAHQEKTFITEDHAKLNLDPKKSPGPAAYGKKSTLGSQLESTSNTEPQWVFGSNARFAKPSVEQLKFPAANAYTLKPAIGGQLDSLKPSQPVYGMGSSTREGVRKIYVSEEHATATFAGVGSPGPASYMLQPAIGLQCLSIKQTPPTWAFAKNERFQDPDIRRAAKLPAPNAYSQPSSVGPQLASTRCSAPLPGFGTSTREHMSKVFLTPAHEKVQFGKASPGPLSYTQHPSIGKQLMSPKRDQPSWGFGSCDRWYTRNMAKRHADLPAPGAYNI